MPCCTVAWRALQPLPPPPLSGATRDSAPSMVCRPSRLRARTHHACAVESRMSFACPWVCLRCVSLGVVRCVSMGVLRCVSLGVLRCVSLGVLRCVSLGVLSCVSLGVLRCVSLGVLRCVSLGGLRLRSVA
eukprot:6182319-Pleurochrysis_carterae.AAC.1